MIARANYNSGLFDEMIVDNFAGGGGASMGIESALGRSVDVAINHNAEAIMMHQANHPHTFHHCEDVFDVDPVVPETERNRILGHEQNRRRKQAVKYTKLRLKDLYGEVCKTAEYAPSIPVSVPTEEEQEAWKAERCEKFGSQNRRKEA